MEALKRDVAGLIAPIPFPLADICYTLCNVANDGRMDLDCLDFNQCRHRCQREESNTHRFSIDKRCVPVLQTTSDESSAGECVMVWILRGSDCCGQ